MCVSFPRPASSGRQLIDYSFIFHNISTHFKKFIAFFANFLIVFDAFAIHFFPINLRQLFFMVKHTKKPALF
jgi:hypothetical protein